MVQTLILTQGALAQELLRAADTINGTSTGVHALCLDWDESLDDAITKARRVADDLAEPDGLLILTDLFGGTPHNVARQLAISGKIEVITGVNLPMVVRLCCRSRDDNSVESLAEWIIGKGQKAIRRDQAMKGGTR
jgi:PTS system mannose-specific IIA component